MDKLNISVKDVKIKGKDLFKIILKRNGNVIVYIDLEKLIKLPYSSFKEQIINLENRLYNILH